MAGLFGPTEGYVEIGDRKLKYLSDRELCGLRRAHFGMIFQKLNLLEHLTALENVLLAAPPGRPPAGARVEARAALDRLGCDQPDIFEH
jgi:ABC-type lipoprotein export system ATPase subunit